MCGTQLTGRNVSSAIRHLSVHQSEYETFVRTEAKRLPNKLNKTRLQKLLSKETAIRAAGKRSADGSYVTIQLVPAPAGSYAATRSGSITETTATATKERSAEEEKEFRQEKLRHYLVELVTTTSVPAHVVDNAVFRKMVTFLDADVRLPSRETLVRDVSRTQQQVLRDMRHMVTQADRVSVGVDRCTRKTVTHGLLAVVVYFWHAPANRPVVLTLALRGLAAGQDVQSLLHSVLTEFGVRDQQVLRVLLGAGCKLSAETADPLAHDEDEEQVTLFLTEECESETGAQWATCLSQAYHKRKVSCFVRLVDTVWKPVEKKSVVFEESVSAASRVLRGLKAADVNALLGEDVVISERPVRRWLPLFGKMQRLVRGRVTVDRLCDEHGVQKLTEQDWRRLTQYDRLLSPFKLVREQQQNRESGISRVLPAVHFLTQHLTALSADPDPDLRQLAADLLSALCSGSQSLTDDPVYVTTTALDPAVHKLLTPEQVDAALAHLRSLAPEFESPDSDPTAGDLTGGAEEDEEQNAFHKFVASAQSAPRSRLDEEVRDYCQIVAANSVTSKTDALTFWSSDPAAERLPLLRRLALHLLCIPSHACDLEQVFVAAGQASQGRRHRISGPHLEAQVLLRTNRSFLTLFDNV